MPKADLREGELYRLVSFFLISSAPWEALGLEKGLSFPSLE